MSAAEMQVRIALRAEKQRSNKQRRELLDELKKQAQSVAQDCQRRQALVATEAARVATARQDHDGRVNERNGGVMEQQRRLQELRAQAQVLDKETEEMAAAVAAGTQRVQESRVDQTKAPAIDTAIERMKERLAKETSELDAYAAIVEKREAAVMERHRLFEEQHPHVASLPTLNAVTTAA